MKKEKNSNKKYTIWQNCCYMIRLSWQNAKSVLVFCTLLILIGVLLNVTKLLVVPVILLDIEKQVSLNILMKTILGFTGILLILSMAKGYIEWNTLHGRIEVRTRITNQLHQKLCITSFPHIEDEEFQTKATAAFQITNGNWQATEAIWDTLEQLMTSIICFVIYLFLLYQLPPLIFVVVILSSIAGFVVTNYTNNWEYRHRDEEDALRSKMQYIVNKSGQPALGKDIRIFGMKNWLEEIYEKNLRLYKDFLDKQSVYFLIGDVIDMLLSILRNGIAYYYLISLVIKNGLTASEFVLYFSAVGGFSDWVNGILENFHTLHTQSLDINLGREFLEYPEEFRFEGGISVPEPQNGTYTIELNDVSFRYPSAEEDTIHHLNLKISAGEKIAVVGLNGAGKTTLVKLICGFYDPTEGEVLLNGVNIKKFNRQEYYQVFSAVFQQFSILASTIADNITQSVFESDEKRIAECIELAGLSEKISELPEHEKTYLTKQVYLDGTELSGGQTQRLMLARALYKNAPILVLDEPTAALDPIAENDIYLKYNDMANGRTSIFISHRLASTRFCDRILFIEDGNILEEGNHDELLARGGAYAELFAVQSKYYNSNKPLDENNEGGMEACL